MTTTTADLTAPALSRENPRSARPAYRSASFRTGVYEFIPVPFLDEWLISRERRKIVKTTLKTFGIGFDRKAVRILAGGGRSFSARLRSFAKALFLKPLRKAFRTVFFWYAARSAARNVVATYFLARFLHHPQLLADREGSHLNAAEARQLAAIFDSVSKNIDLRMLGGAVMKVRSLMGARVATDVDRGELKQAIEHEAPGFIAEFDWLVAARLREIAW